MPLNSLVACHCRRVGSPASNTVKFVTEATQVDLSARTELMAEVPYSIHVFAMNSIGESNSSNDVTYTRLQEGQLIRCLRVDTVHMHSCLSYLQLKVVLWTPKLLPFPLVAVLQGCFSSYYVWL